MRRKLKRSDDIEIGVRVNQLGSMISSRWAVATAVMRAEIGKWKGLGVIVVGTGFT